MILEGILQVDLIRNFVLEVNKYLEKIDCIIFIKVASVLIITVCICSALVLANDRLMEVAIKKRVKKHRLTIRNQGNSAAIYLMHTVDLPETLAIRFRMDGNPMIWVSLNPDKQNPERAGGKTNEENEQKPPQNDEDQEHDSDSSSSALIPNLANPMDSVGTVTKTINEVGKKAGFFASIFSTISSLLPISSPGLKEAQSSLKNIQQQSNEMVGTINTKTNAVNTLGDQLGKLPFANQAGEAAKAAGDNALNELKGAAANDMQQVVRPEINKDDDENDENLYLGEKFVYDERVWVKNIGKVDENGGALNYAQSNVLKPGESMKVDIEIMNLSESDAAVSHLYKLEVLQVPQTKLHFSNVRRYVNGIVIFDKISQLERLFPTGLTFVLIFVAIQIIAAYTYLIF